MAVIERNLPAEEQPAQLPLFEMMDGRYEVVVTNLHLNCIRRLTQPKGLKTARIKRIVLLLLHLPANVIRCSR
jgi:hypothetical protein